MARLTRTFLIPKDKTPEYLILIIALFLIILVWTLILYFSRGNSSVATIKAYETCNPGECPTNIESGEKRCSTNPNLPLQYSPEFEVCNPPDSCTSSTTPYALQLDGSSSFDDECGPNNPNCRCVKYFSTPSYTQVLFNSMNGTLYNSENNRTILTQAPNPYYGQGNNIPITYQDPTTQFFELSPSLLGYIAPSPCSILFQNGPLLPDYQTLACINKNPCVYGRMAYVPVNTTFDETKINSSIPVACVPNSVTNPPDLNNHPNSCITDDPIKSLYEYAPVFNLSSGRIDCVSVNLSSS
jgi:hypothetical protein